MNRFITAVAALLLASVAPAQEEDPAKEAAKVVDQVAKKADPEKEKDPNRGRFLAIPLFITEPAIGQGLGAGLIYFHREKPETPSVVSAQELGKTADNPNKPPPTATGIFGMYTNNDTAAVGIGHARTFKDDRYRLIGALASARINATYYLGDRPFRFGLDGEILFSKLKRRMGDSNFFLGAAVSVVDATVEWKYQPNTQELSPFIDFDFTDVGVSLSAIYDSRDDTMSPTKGGQIDLSLWRYDESIGGDFNYSKGRLKMHMFRQLLDDWAFGLRFDTEWSNGNVPFYAEPFVRLRGIPALRFSGERAGVVEMELRYRFAKRWGLVGFAGKGFVEEIKDVVSTENDIKAYGFGVRFQALEKQNVWLGIDVAKGPEETVWYIQMGHPW